MSKQDELKKIAAEKKALADKQKALREELKESAAERTKSREQRTTGRKEFAEAKSSLRTHLAKSYVVLKDGDAEEVAEFADQITELSSKMTTAARNCSEALEQLEGL